MIGHLKMSGVWSAVLTPIDQRLRPDVAKAIDYYNELLCDGIDGLNILGTNGEASSFGIDQRAAFMKAVARDVPLERAIVGTGATSLEDTVHLTRTAFECGFAGALIMPPFFYRFVNDDGVVAFFDALFAGLEDRKGSVILYNFPAASGITFGAALVDRLIAEFPEFIAGMKDSSNDRALQQVILAKHPGFTMLPSSEEHLATAHTDGIAGCISGTVALWPQLARIVWKTGEGAEHLADLRRNVAAPNLLVRVRYLTSKVRNDASWERPMPPLTQLSEVEKQQLDAIFSSAR